MTFEGLVLKREVNFLLYAMSSWIHIWPVQTGLNHFWPFWPSYYTFPSYHWLLISDQLRHLAARGSCVSWLYVSQNNIVFTHGEISTFYYTKFTRIIIMMSLLRNIRLKWWRNTFSSLKLSIRLDQDGSYIFPYLQLDRTDS